MFAKLTLGMSKLIAFRTNPIKTLLTEDPNSLIGEEKVKSVADIARVLNEILKKIVGPILSAIGIAAVIYAIYLGVMYAKAESADKRKEIQGRLIGAIVGAVIIIIAATLCFSINWAGVYWNFTGDKHVFVDSNKDNLCDWCLQDATHAIHGK